MNYCNFIIKYYKQLTYLFAGNLDNIYTEINYINLLGHYDIIGNQKQLILNICSKNALVSQSAVLIKSIQYVNNFYYNLTVNKRDTTTYYFLEILF